MLTGVHPCSPVLTTHPDKPISQMHRETAKVTPFGQVQVTHLQQCHHPGSFLASLVSAQLCTERVCTQGLQEKEHETHISFHSLWQIVPTWVLFLVEQISEGEAEG